MHNLSLIEECYKKFISNLYYWIPEGIYTVNLDLLYKFDLLHFQYPEKQAPVLTPCFHIIESPEKVTLINEEYIIWIVPDRVDNIPMTYTLIALNKEDQPKLELVFVTSGVYNTSKLVLKILERFLIEIQENESVLNKIK